MESIHNKITKILISIQVYHNCRKSALKSSLGLHLQMKRQLNSNRHLEEIGVGVEGLVGEGQLFPTPFAVATSSRPDVATVEMYPE